jgi:hypothetical protein
MPKIACKTSNSIEILLIHFSKRYLLWRHTAYPAYPAYLASKLRRGFKRAQVGSGT